MDEIPSQRDRIAFALHLMEPTMWDVHDVTRPQPAGRKESSHGKRWKLTHVGPGHVNSSRLILKILSLLRTIEVPTLGAVQLAQHRTASPRIDVQAGSCAPRRYEQAFCRKEVCYRANLLVFRRVRQQVL